MSKDGNAGDKIVMFPGSVNDIDEIVDLAEALLDPESENFIGASPEALRLLRLCLREVDDSGDHGSIAVVDGVALRFLRAAESA